LYSQREIHITFNPLLDARFIHPLQRFPEQYSVKSTGY
jgi:hypothetical protein